MLYSDAFCDVYNIFGWNYYPEAFAEQLLLWMEQNHARPENCLDLGCGTGILCQILHDHGIVTSGLDLSEGMIRIAREQNPDLSFEVADMIVYRPNMRYDLVTCTGDALNHIHKLRDLETIFRNVHDYLTDGGYFIFDILNENEVSDDEPFDLKFSDTVRARFQMSKQNDGMVTLSVSVYENGEFLFDERIHEKIHDPSIICEMLRNCGFDVLKCSDRLPDHGNYHGTTWYIVAKK